MLVDVRILKLNDPAPWPDIAKVVGPAIPLERAAIMEVGMESGKTSVALLGKTPDGKWVMIETSAAIFETLAGAVKGACQRFGDAR